MFHKHALIFINIAFLATLLEVCLSHCITVSDCLDNGNNKKAIQEADKVLKKQKDLQCAKVYSYRGYTTKVLKLTVYIVCQGILI